MIVGLTLFHISDSDPFCLGPDVIWTPVGLITVSFEGINK